MNTQERSAVQDSVIIVNIETLRKLFYSRRIIHEVRSQQNPLDDLSAKFKFCKLDKYQYPKTKQRH
jgi:hypothetical protein